MISIITNLSIKKRLFFLSGLILILLSMMILVSLISFRWMNRQFATADLLHHEVVHLQMVIKGLNEFVITEGTIPSFQLTKEGIKKFDSTYKELLSTVRNNEEIYQELTAKISPSWEKIRNNIESFLKLQPNVIREDESLMKYGKLSAESDALFQEMQTIADTVQKQSNKSANTLVTVMTVIAASITFTIIIIIYTTYKSIAMPIVEIVAIAEKAASGNLTANVEIKSRDEIASLGNAINIMTSNLKDVISKIGRISNSVSDVTSHIASSSKNILEIADVQKKAVEETASAIEEMDSSIATVSTGAESLSKSASDTSSSIIQLSTAIEKIAENAREFSDKTQTTTSSIEEMIANIKEITDSVERLSISSVEIASSIEEVNDATKNIAQSAHESVTLAEKVMSNASEKGIPAASSAVEGMEIIKSSVSALSDVIHTLGKRSSEIGKILNVINNVADQTNLLALNAAILAAKAGEHGRGFSIVANEIKDLAERTSKSTMEIASLIKSVQEEAQASVRMATEGVQTVQNGIKLVKDVNDALTEILDSAKVSTDMARAIQKATSEETVIINHITNSIEAMTKQIENISRAIREQNKGSNSIIDAAEKMNEISIHLKIAINEQRDGSRQIVSVTEDVTQEVAQIADSTGRQKEKSVDIVRSMEKIRNATGNLAASADEMSGAINSLKDETVNLLTELRRFRV